MRKQQPIAVLKKSLKHWTAFKITLVIAGVFGGVLAAIIAVSTIVAAVTAPLAAVQQPIQWLFGHTDEDPDPDSTQQLTDCMIYRPADLEPALTQIPNSTDPGVAQGWIMYTLAHPETSGSQAPSAPTRSSATPATTSRGSTAQRRYQSLGAFSQAWRTATPAGTTAASASPAAQESGDAPFPTPPIPQQLTALDPATSYTGYAVAGVVGTLELDNRGVIELDDDYQNELAQSLAVACFKEAQ